MTTSLTRTFDHGEFDSARLARIKGGKTVSVCLPARDEAATVGRIVDVIRAELVERVRLVDEIVVIDDGSTDATAEVATAAGARVEEAAAILPEAGPGGGKGDALWKSVHAAEGDLVVWCDADVTDFEPRFVTGLLGPLLTHPEIEFVKGFYDRPLAADSDAGGGRVTELVARPLVSLLHPRLAAIVQPLSGEYGGRRELLETLPFVRGYGVDLGLLIDVAERCGSEGLAQVDLGTRRHRNRSLAELGPTAMAVMQTAFVRAGLPIDGALAATLVRPGLEPLECVHLERPPLVTLPAYTARRRQLAARHRTA